MQSVYDKIAQWGADRNITTGGSSVAQQHLKLVEERFELSTGFVDKDGSKLEDSIGDQIVVLIMQAKMLDPSYNLNAMFPLLYEVTETQRHLHLSVIENFTDTDDVGSCHLKQVCYYVATGLDMLYETHTGAVSRGRPTLTDIRNIAYGIKSLAALLDLNFTLCVENSYLAIKDRKGRMDNGVFIKEADDVNAGTK